MKHFRDWKIATKLYMMLGILLSMLLFLGLFGLKDADDINKRVNELYFQELKPLETIEDMKTSFFQVREQVGRHISEPELHLDHEENIQEQLKRLAKNESEYRQSRLAKEENRLMAVYQVSWAKYLALVNDKVLPLSRSGRVEAAEDVLYGPAHETFEKATEAINELAEYQLDRAQRRYESAQEEYETMRVTTISLIIAGMLLASILGWFLVRSLVSPLLEVRNVLRRMSEGDLTNQANYQSDDEIGEMVITLNNSIFSQREMVNALASIVEQLSTASEEMSMITNQTSQTIKKQQYETEQVATAMNEMTVTVQEVAANTTDTANAANDANTQTNDGNKVVQQAITQINKLAEQIEISASAIKEVEEHSEAINAILDVIKGIAEQTNLLALNAAIEAARAGEQGRGFAVVADEVRTLAGRTRQSTEEINLMIEKLQIGSRQAVSSMESSREQAGSVVDYASQSGEALRLIALAVEKINEMSTHIAASAEQQGVTSEEINRNIIRINDMATQTSDDSDNIATASQNLAVMATKMQDWICKFKY